MKRIYVILIIFGTVVLISFFNLFSRYSFLSAHYDLWTIGIVYPQCEFDGADLERLNSISKEMGFEVRKVDCDIFYTRGMDNYYKIMSSRIEERNGIEWLNELYDKRRTNPNTR